MDQGRLSVLLGLFPRIPTPESIVEQQGPRIHVHSIWVSRVWVLAHEMTLSSMTLWVLWVRSSISAFSWRLLQAGISSPSTLTVTISVLAEVESSCGKLTFLVRHAGHKNKNNRMENCSFALALRKSLLAFFFAVARACVRPLPHGLMNLCGVTK